MGPVDEAGKVAGGIVESLKGQPLSLALVVMNVALLVLFYFIVKAAMETRQREITQLHQEQKEVRELLTKCYSQQRSNLPDAPLSTWAYTPGNPCRLD